jgi:AcrR family transcriptional regulator
MPAKRRVTRDAILDEARRIVAEEGTGALTFQLLASRLGVSKQAIIYWYPSKAELVRDFCLPVLGAEAAAVSAAMEGVEGAPAAIEAFVRTIVTYHLADLARFRLVYLWVQFEPDIVPEPVVAKALLDPIHATTSSGYDLLEAAIAADPEFTGGQSPRTLAVAVDMAAVGLITMLAMADAVDDPWKQSPEELLDALVALLTRPPGEARRAQSGGRTPGRRPPAVA